MTFDKEKRLNEIDRQIEKLLEQKMRIQQKVRDAVANPRVVYQWGNRVLSGFANHGMRLIHIESRPVLDRNWEYMYFLEITGSLTDSGMEELMLSVKDAPTDFRLFGNYASNL